MNRFSKLFYIDKAINIIRKVPVLGKIVNNYKTNIIASSLNKELKERPILLTYSHNKKPKDYFALEFANGSKFYVRNDKVLTIGKDAEEYSLKVCGTKIFHYNIYGFKISSEKWVDIKDFPMLW